MNSVVNSDFSNQATLPQGFKAAGTVAGLKKTGKPDMAIIYSENPAALAAVFTQNKVCAAPVKICREKLSSQTAQAVVINSGNANACTGDAGIEDAKEMANLTGSALGIDPALVMVSSTGHIGVRLPMDIISSGIAQASTELSYDGGTQASEAIMTTDTVPKRYTTTLLVDGIQVRLTGIAKGAGMIEPNMATMLSYLMTDAAVDPDALQACLSTAVDKSFNRISVDGDMSTNDSVLLLANGASGSDLLDADHADWPTFVQAVEDLTFQLAMDIVSDGEGAHKVITIQIQGAASDEDADRGARAIANSFLVKTSWSGNFPHWGRIMDVLGYSGISIDENAVDISFDDQMATLNGLATDIPLDTLKGVVAKEAFTIAIDLKQGQGEAVIYTCECTEEYVRINM